MDHVNRREGILKVVKDGQVIYSSTEVGLKSLLDALEKCRSHGDGFVLYDRVVGLAAARLIVYAGTVARVIAEVTTKDARDFLTGHGIPIEADSETDNIMTRDRLSVCPGEQAARRIVDPMEFIKEMKKNSSGYCEPPPEPDFENCRGQCGFTPWCRTCMDSRNAQYR